MHLHQAKRIKSRVFAMTLILMLGLFALALLIWQSQASGVAQAGGGSIRIEIEGTDPSIEPIEVDYALEIETEVRTFRAGGENDIVLKLPGPTTYSNIFLKAPVTEEGMANLWRWYDKIIHGDGDVDKRSAVIIVLVPDPATGEPIEAVRYCLFGAWPAIWRGHSEVPNPRPKGDKRAPVEEVELAVDGIIRDCVDE